MPSDLRKIDLHRRWTAVFGLNRKAVTEPPQKSRLSLRREVGLFGRRFHTGHEVFDQIVQVNYGCSILMLDETFSEARNLLMALFEHYGQADAGPPIEFVSHPAPEHDERILDVGGMSLSDLSIAVNNYRRKFKTQRFIHSYLPDAIIKNRPEDLLRLIGAWQRHVVENGTVEFYLLPRRVFEDIERKLISLVDGAIEIRVSRAEGKFASSFIPIRCCRPEHHLHEFPYMIEPSRVLVKWEGEFTDKLIGISKEEIRRRVEHYRQNISSLRVVPGAKEPIAGLSIYDYWLLSQVKDQDLASIQLLFPERFDAILERLTRWEIEGVIDVEATTAPSQLAAKYKRRRGLSWRTRLGLHLPTPILGYVLRRRIGKVRSVPTDLYVSSKQAAMALSTLLIEREGVRRTDILSMSLSEMEKRFSEMAARLTAIQNVTGLGEDPSVKVDVAHVPKIIKLTLSNGYGLKARVKTVNHRIYEVEVKDCFLCGEAKDTRPICAAIEGGLEAVCGVIFKVRATCEEFMCRAVGDPGCRFRLRLAE